MKSLVVITEREQLLDALSALGRNRRQRFTSKLPVWLSWHPDPGIIRISEARNAVEAIVDASGNWPSTGATVNLFSLRGTVATVTADQVELHLVANGVLVPRTGGFHHLDLLSFGPEPRVSRSADDSARIRRHGVAEDSDLPLFRHAALRRDR